MTPKKQRADRLLVEAELAPSDKAAQALILAGKVFATDAGGREKKIATAGELIPASHTLRVATPEHPYVSRGGVKLARALDAFGIDPRGAVCLDVGVSTGGFTDCLLQRGAARVHAVDVGYGQTAWKLRNDPRVVLHERTNARELTEAAFGERAQLAVIDVSFIGVSKLLPAVLRQLEPNGQVVVLVKPQFEAPPEHVAPGGVVVEEAHREAAIASGAEAARALGLVERGRIESPITGADGNVELLLHLVFGGP